MEKVLIGISQGAIIIMDIGHTKCIDLIYTGNTRSCISEAYYHTVQFPNCKHLLNVIVKSTTGNNVQCSGLVMCDFTLEQKPHSLDFIMCAHLQRFLIPTIGFLK